VLVRLILAAVLIPLVELVLLDQLRDHIGLAATIGIVLITGVIGAWLARRQGRAVWLQIHRQLQRGQTPSREITEGVMILIAGAFLITPGLLTDALGFLLLMPQFRTAAARLLTAWFLKRTAMKFQSATFVRSTGFADEDVTTDGSAKVRVVDPHEQSLDEP
jgi:UPF0716 protein FxsA